MVKGFLKSAASKYIPRVAKIGWRKRGTALGAAGRLRNATGEMTSKIFSRVDDVASKLASYEETQIVATTSGDHDIIVKAISRDIKSLWKFINKRIKTLEGIKPDMDVSGSIDVYKMTHFIKFQGKTA